MNLIVNGNREMEHGRGLFKEHLLIKRSRNLVSLFLHMYVDNARPEFLQS